MESEPQNPEFWNNPENFHLCNEPISIMKLNRCFDLKSDDTV